MKSILVIEDDKEIAAMLLEFLEQHLYKVQVETNGIQGLATARLKEVDLILLDLMLPYKSGDEILRELRENSQVPVIVMSAKTMIQTKVELLRLGADDYVTKPFDLQELLARIEVNLKRSGSTESVETMFSYGDITINSDEKLVQLEGAILPLTSKEFALLELMMRNPKKVFSKQNLYEHIWQEAYAYDDNTINTHISNIRKKMKDQWKKDYIETVWGMGYKMIKL